MDVYEFTHEGTLFKVEPGRVDYERRATEAIGGGVDLAVQGSSLAALCAEILRLAEEVARLNRQIDNGASKTIDLEAQVAEQARTIDEARLQLDAVAAKSRRRKAKIRKLRAELDVARVGDYAWGAKDGREGERKAVLAYLEDLRGKFAGYIADVLWEAKGHIRSGAHLTALASPPQEPSPSGKSAQE